MIETTGQLETIEWTKEFLKWLPDLYKSNIFEAIKSIEIGLVLERPNMTDLDTENIKQALDILKRQQLATPENIVNLNKIVYHPDSIEIDGILFDRNNLSWWKGIFNEETQERHYNAKGMMKTLKQQNKMAFMENDFKRLFNGSLIWKEHEPWQALNILWIILWHKKPWYLNKRWELLVTDMAFLTLLSKDSKMIHYIFNPQVNWPLGFGWLFNEWDYLSESNFWNYAPVRPILWYNPEKRPPHTLNIPNL